MSTLPWETICSVGPPGHSLPIEQFPDPFLGSPLPARSLPLLPYVLLLRRDRNGPRVSACHRGGGSYTLFAILSSTVFYRSFLTSS